MGTRRKRQASKGGKPARSLTVTVRLDPRLRYLAELAARRHRRTLSSFIEWAIAQQLEQVSLTEHGDSFRDLNVLKDAQKLWHVEEADRFAKLAWHYPGLLEHEEQVLWKLIRECAALWDQPYQWGEPGGLDYLRYALLREHWDAFRAVARGDAEPSVLSTVVPSDVSEDEDPNPKISDDIPF